MNWKRILPVVIVILLIGGVAGYAIHRHEEDTKPVVAASTTPAPQVKDLTYKGEDGKTAMTLLKAKYTVTTTHYSFGDSVDSINGLAADSKHYWEFMVNGTDASVGADAYTSKSTDTIEWKYANL